MPVIKGIGKREGESRDDGAATLIIGFPHATLKVAKRDAQTGAITFDSKPNPHDRAFNLSELRGMQTVLEAGSAIRQFYEQAESMLLHHIESLASAAPSGMADDHPAATTHGVALTT